MSSTTTLRLLRLTPFFHHPDVRAWPARYDAVGGMQVQILRQARWMARHGVEQDVLTAGFPGLPRRRELEPGLWVERCFLGGLELPSEISGVVGLTHRWALASLGAIVRRLGRRRYDLVHLHADGQIPALLVGPIVARMLGVPLVLTIHCSRLGVYRPQAWLDALQHARAQAIERWALRHAALATTLTPTTSQTLRAHAERTPIEVVPDVVDLEPLRRAATVRATAELRERHGISPQAPVVAYVGRIAAEKGWRHLLPLAQRLRSRGAHVLVVGDGPQRARLEHELAQHGLHGSFSITGFVPNEQAAVAIRAADVVVMPSEYEEFGGTAIEALGLERPVVAFAVGGLRHVIGELDPSLLVPPGDVDALVGRVAALLERRGQPGGGWPRLAAQVSRRYHPDEVLGRLLSQYQALAGVTSTPERAHDDGRWAA